MRVYQQKGQLTTSEGSKAVSSCLNLLIVNHSKKKKGGRGEKEERNKKRITDEERDAGKRGEVGEGPWGVKHPRRPEEDRKSFQVRTSESKSSTMHPEEGR